MLGIIFFAVFIRFAFEMVAVKQKWFKADGFTVKPMTAPVTLKFLFSCSMAWSDPIDLSKIRLLLTVKLSLRYPHVWTSFPKIERCHASITQLVMCKEVFC